MAAPKKKPAFEKVGECLLRYVPTGVYYARFQHGKTKSGKPKGFRRSLDTTDRALAKRRLADLQRATARTSGAGDKLTLKDLCDLYLATMAHQKEKTLYRKRAIAERIKKDWPGGADVAVSKVQQSTIAAWLASYTFGVASYPPTVTGHSDGCSSRAASSAVWT